MVPGSPSAQSSLNQAAKPCKSPTNLRTLEINFQSISAKREVFWSLVDAVKPDIIYGCETWLKPDIRLGEIFPPGYNLYRKDRSDGYGGVLLGIHSSLSSHQLDISTEAEFVGAKIISGEQSFIVCALYRPTNNNLEYMVALNQAIESVYTDNPRSAIWIAGDINLPDIEWATDEIVGHQYSAALNEKFLEMKARTGLEQIIDFPTRGNNTLDVILTNRPSLINCCEPMPGLSDHSVVYADWNIIARKQKLIRRKIFLWKRADFDSIRSKTQSWTENFQAKYSSSTPVEVLAREIDIHLKKTLQEQVPSKFTSTRFNQPWFSTATKQICRKKARAYKKAMKSNRVRDWRRFRRLKKKAQSICRQAYNQYLSDIICSEPGGGKRLGAIIKAKRCDQAGVAPLKDGNFMHSDPKVKANILNRQFASVFTDDKTAASPDLGTSTHPTMNDIKINSAGIAKLMRNLNPHKATGPDGVPARLLKEIANEIAPAISTLFQATLNQGTIPAVWKEALVVPLFKKGNRSSPVNYRPVSLTSILCKLCEHVIHSAIINHLSANKILCDAQHGFRKSRSCDTQLILTINDLAKGLEDKEQTDLILLDFSKAFDKVSHRLLLQKMEHYGVHGATLNWVKDFLSQRTQQVLVDGQMSTQANVTSGVPQGSVLGPLLFLVFINDLPDCVKSSTTRLFADDTAVYRRIMSPEDAILLQQDLDALQKWEKTWLMEFHPAKCKVLRITNKRKPTPSAYTIHGMKLEEVKSAKYLGLTIDNKLSFNPHVDSTAKKANSTRAFLQRNFHHCNRRIKEATYKTYIRPIVEYAAPACDPHTHRSINKLEQVQRNSARYVTNTYDRRASITKVLNQLKWPSLQSRRQQIRLSMLYRIRYNLVDITWTDHLTAATSNTRGHNSRFFKPHIFNDVYKYSFFPRTSHEWNHLKKDPRDFATLDAFKVALREGTI